MSNTPGDHRPPENSQDDVRWPEAATSEEVTTGQLTSRLSQPGAVPRLIDCREDDEFAYNRIAGAEHVPLSRWAELAPALLKRHGDETLVVYCHHGVRSMRAIRWLRAHGHADCFSLAGGIDQWSSDVDPSVPKY